MKIFNKKTEIRKQNALLIAAAQFGTELILKEKVYFSQIDITKSSDGKFTVEAFFFLEGYCEVAKKGKIKANITLVKDVFYYIPDFYLDIDVEEDRKYLYYDNNLKFSDNLTGEERGRLINFFNSTILSL